MDHSTIFEMNEFLVSIFNEILLIEETSEVAKKIAITMGTLSVSIQNLVKKGYVERVSSPSDRRVVLLKLTKRGKLLYRMHRKFHLNMVAETLNGMEPEEAATLVKGLRNLHRFLDNAKQRLGE